VKVAVVAAIAAPMEAPPPTSRRTFSQRSAGHASGSPVPRMPKYHSASDASWRCLMRRFSAVGSGEACCRGVLVCLAALRDLGAIVRE
jgi:hypothetical protein